MPSGSHSAAFLLDALRLSSASIQNLPYLQVPKFLTMQAFLLKQSIIALRFDFSFKASLYNTYSTTFTITKHTIHYNIVEIRRVLKETHYGPLPSFGQLKRDSTCFTRDSQTSGHQASSSQVQIRARVKVIPPSFPPKLRSIIHHEYIYKPTPRSHFSHPPRTFRVRVLITEQMQINEKIRNHHSILHQSGQPRLLMTACVEILRVRRNPTQHLVQAIFHPERKLFTQIWFPSRKPYHRRHADCITCRLAVSYQDKPHPRPDGRSPR